MIPDVGPTYIMSENFVTDRRFLAELAL